MTRNRFQNIPSNFHITDNEFPPGTGQPSYDPVYKIQTLINSSN